MPRLSPNAIDQTRRAVRNAQRTPWPRREPSEAALSAGAGIYIAKTGSSGIPARSGTTPGSATCALYYINAAGALTAHLDAESNPVTKTVFNLSTEEVAANTYIQVKQELLSGKLLADWEDC